MKEVAACGFFILLFDAVLGLALWAGLWLRRCSGCGGLAGVWAIGAAKWAALHVFTLALTERKPQAVLCRLVALLCLLSPVYESGRIFMEPPSEPYLGPSPDLNMLLLGPLSSVLACMVWEKGLCGNAKMKKGTVKLDARRLLMRMVKYFKPDTFYLIAAFSFLILGVICKCKNTDLLHFTHYTHLFHLYDAEKSLSMCPGDAPYLIPDNAITPNTNIEIMIRGNSPSNHRCTMCAYHNHLL